MKLDVAGMGAVLLPPVTKKQQRIQKAALAEMVARLCDATVRQMVVRVNPCLR